MKNASTKPNTIETTPTEPKTTETAREVKKPELEHPEKTTKKQKDGKAKSRVSIAVFFVGIAALVAGIVFLLINLLMKPAVRDADFLVDIRNWEREDEPGVIWTFTEIGKGKLTTNNHTNDYDFIWAIDGDELKIETDWLYTLENNYAYELNQEQQILTLTTGEGENSVSINFHPTSSADTEVVQDN